jgi:hypothetical protein
MRAYGTQTKEDAEERTAMAMDGDARLHERLGQQG